VTKSLVNSCVPVQPSVRITRGSKRKRRCPNDTTIPEIRRTDVTLLVTAALSARSLRRVVTKQRRDVKLSRFQVLSKDTESGSKSRRSSDESRMRGFKRSRSRSRHPPQPRSEREREREGEGTLKPELTRITWREVKSGRQRSRSRVNRIIIFRSRGERAVSPRVNSPALLHVRAHPEDSN